MIKNRKPMFVSETAHELIKKLANDLNVYMGDIVDMMVESIKEELKDKEVSKTQ